MQPEECLMARPLVPTRMQLEDCTEDHEKPSPVAADSSKWASKFRSTFQDTRRYENPAFWEEYYSHYRDQQIEWGGGVSDEILDPIRAILNELPASPQGRKKRVCELGCGASSLAVALAADGFDVVGVDFSSEVIAQNHKRHPEVEWYCCDVLQLANHFDPASFDCLVGKTLLDCFLTRRDGDASIRGLFQQARIVLKDHGRFACLDKAVSVPSLFHAGTKESITIGSRPKMCIFLRVFKVQVQQTSSETLSPLNHAVRWVAKLPPLHDHITTRRMGGSGILTVWTVDEFADEAGLKPNDRFLGFDKSDGKGMQFGNAAKLQKMLLRDAKDSPDVLDFLVERPAAGAASHQKSNSKLTTLASRRSLSQTDFLLRQQRARDLQTQSMPTLPACPDSIVKATRRKSSYRPLKSLTLSTESSDHISTQVCAAKGLFI